MRKPIVLLLAAGVLGGCPKHHTTTTPPSGKERIACPTGDALSALVHAFFAGGGGDPGDVDATCVAVFTDRAQWVLDGYQMSSTQDGVALVTVLVDASTKQEVWTSGADDFSYPPGAIDRMSGPGMSAVDLDGDGRDEIIDISGTSAQGYDVESLTVYTIGAASLEPAGEIGFSEDNSAADPDPADLVSCSTAWKLIAGPEGSKQLDLTVTAEHPGGDSSCLAPGHHVMKWTGKALVEVP